MKTINEDHANHIIIFMQIDAQNAPISVYLHHIQMVIHNVYHYHSFNANT